MMTGIIERVIGRRWAPDAAYSCSLLWNACEPPRTANRRSRRKPVPAGDVLHETAHVAGATRG
jgi:hypothetical protein